MAHLFTAYFSEDGAPKGGLSPVIDIWEVGSGIDTLVINGAAMTEISNTKVSGAYIYSYAGADNTKDYFGRADSVTLTGNERYSPCGSGVEGKVNQILADTNELQTDWTDGGRLDVIIDALLFGVTTLYTDWINGGRLDLLIDAIKAKTDTIPTDPLGLGTVFEGAITIQDFYRLMLSRFMTEADGADTNTLNFYDPTGVKKRIILTVDALGNRTLAVLDADDV